MEFVSYNLVAVIAFAAYVAAAICWQRTQPAPMQTGGRATTPAESASPSPTNRLFTTR
jgi:hypothetical protein